MSPIATSPVMSLLGLPNEILRHIAGQVSQRSDLVSLIQTCKAMAQISDPLLYRHVDIESAKSLLALPYALTSRPGRTRLIRSLQFRRLSQTSAHKSHAYHNVIIVAARIIGAVAEHIKDLHFGEV